MAPPLLLRAVELTVRYLTRRAPAVRDVSFGVAPGERVLLAGASGSGKSTLALCLAGLIPASIDADLTGRIEVAGRSTLTYRAGEVAEHVGVVFQDPTSQFTMLTVEDEVAFGLENLGVPAVLMPGRVRAALAAVALEERAGWRIDRLSGGQQQRVAVAAALAMQPAALVLDEPTAHLDASSATEVYAVIHAAAERGEMALVAVEHEVDRIIGPGHVDRGLLLDREGRLVADGLVNEFFSNPAMARRWALEGVRLPTPTALALALGETGPLPVSPEQGIAWLRQRPVAQAALRRAAASPISRLPTGKDIVRTSGVWHRYQAPAGSFLALRDVSVSVAEGELVAIVGANGSGKTTLLRALTGVLRPERGAITIDDTDLRSADARRVARLVSHVFQNPEAGFVAATVEDELAYAPRALGWAAPEIERHTRALLERFGLAPLARANPFTLSEGQKRRLSVAASLMLGPRVLLLDEPTFGQDRVSAQALMDDIAGLRQQGLAIVVATHDLSLVTETADRVVALADGRVVFDGRPATLAGDARLLTSVRQEQPTLDRLLAMALIRGADVPRSVRWRDLVGRA